MDKCTPHSFKWERARHPTVISQKIKSRQIHTSVSSYRRVRAQRQLEIYPRGLSWKRMGIVFWTYLRLFLCLTDKKKEKKNASGSWLTYAKHFSFVVQRSCIETKHTRLQFCSFFFSSFVIHHSDALRWTQMDITGHWALCVTGVWSPRWARITPGQITVSYLLWWNMKFLKREGFFFCCSSSSLLYFWIIFVLKCATGRPLSQNVWQLRPWVFGVNGAGWDDEVS